MRVLMTGPGYGHNIQPWLEYYENRSPGHQLFFLCNEFKFERRDFPHIHVLEYGGRRGRLIRTLLSLRKERFDVLYIHGAFSPSHALLLLYLVNCKRSVVNVWGYSVLERARSAALGKRFLFRHVLGRVDNVFLNWHGTKARFESYFPHLRQKAVLTPWGLHNDWFQGGNVREPSEFTRNFLARISPGARVCFWPKSLVRPNRFDLVIAALDRIKSADPDLLGDFVLYIWPGNVGDDAYRSELNAMVRDMQLQRHIVFVDHPYVAFADMYHLWQRADFGLNIADYDQLSTTVLEPMLLGKDVLLSDIEAYRFLNEEYSLGLELVRNEVEEVAAGLRRMLVGSHRPSQALLDHRRRVVEREFRFDTNVDKIMDFLAERTQVAE